jgi:phage repressor protein C with HTH and peptisase S24 domain
MEIADKLRAAREEMSLSQKQVANRVGMTQQSYEAIEAGRTQRSKFLPRIAQVLGLDLRDLDTQLEALAAPEIPKAPELTGFGGDFPVYSSAEGGPGEIIRSVDAVEWVPRPAPVQHVREAYGMLISGTSMFPEFKAGDTALVNPRAPLVLDEAYVFYTEIAGEARATIKHLDRVTEKDWYVRQWNPPGTPQFKLSRKEWPICHRVLGKYSRR